jgi:hypothetical protein
MTKPGAQLPVVFLKRRAVKKKEPGVESHIVQRWAVNLAMTSALDVRIAEQGPS